MVNKVAVIGYGYWGPNITRNLCSILGAKNVVVVDIDSRRRNKAVQDHGVITVECYKQLQDISSVVICSPPDTHVEIAKYFLDRKIPTLIEKPLALSYKDAVDIANMSKLTKTLCMVDHTFLYSPSVRRIKELLAYGVLGDIEYVDMKRINLGLFQTETDVMFDLLPHDLSILMYLFGNNIAVKNAVVKCSYGNLPSICYTVLTIGSVLVNINVSWISPVKIRQTIISGHKTLIYNDVEPDKKIAIYDKGIDMQNDNNIRYRTGDITYPDVFGKEPLNEMLIDFLDCQETNSTPVSNINLSLDVIKVIEEIKREAIKV